MYINTIIIIEYNNITYIYYKNIHILLIRSVDRILEYRIYNDGRQSFFMDWDRDRRSYPFPDPDPPFVIRSYADPDPVHH